MPNSGTACTTTTTLGRGDPQSGVAGQSNVSIPTTERVHRTKNPASCTRCIFRFQASSSPWPRHSPTMFASPMAPYSTKPIFTRPGASAPNTTKVKAALIQRNPSAAMRRVRLPGSARGSILGNHFYGGSASCAGSRLDAQEAIQVQASTGRSSGRLIHPVRRRAERPSTTIDPSGPGEEP